LGQQPFPPEADPPYLPAYGGGGEARYHGSLSAAEVENSSLTANPMENLIKRSPEILLPLSLRFAKEYFEALCKMQKDIEMVQESKELTITQRALWTALIIEVGRLFDKHDDVISFKQTPYLEDKINKYHGETIIGKIIETRNTFTGHFAKKAEIVITASEICNSNLGKILDEMCQLPINYS
jgi:hypothetical protein